MLFPSVDSKPARRDWTQLIEVPTPASFSKKDVQNVAQT